MPGNDYSDAIARNLNIKTSQVRRTLELLNGGATIPFISRYRKEFTEGLDEVVISEILKQYKKLDELNQRKQTVLKSIREQDKLTGELESSILACRTLTELEDLYLPYKPRKKTRASVAREKGLEPLARIILEQTEVMVREKALTFLSETVGSVEEALQGARDIVAEWISENKAARDLVREYFATGALLSSRVLPEKEGKGDKYKDYFHFSETFKKCPSHRLLALYRGEEEKILKLDISPAKEQVREALEKKFVRSVHEGSQQLILAVHDTYDRLLKPSIENEFRKIAKVQADEEAIRVFADNLRQLLLAPPLGRKRIMAIDPGYRTGCKIVCLDSQGNILHNETIYPHPPQNDQKLAAKKILSLTRAFKTEAIAIGNGTASRETEHFIRKISFTADIQVFVVSENGASVYSASGTAREEMPEYDVTVRGAVSIGRRLMDPLAELVKIDPKSIGVGQYQHDVDQKKLKESLNEVVESCVNLVGVNVNTASKSLLTFVSGLGPQLAENIIRFRRDNGAFTSRKQLMQVPLMGPRAFEQSAGFLRIDAGDNPLDNSAVHPESYHIVGQMAADLSCTVPELLADDRLRRQIVPERYIHGTAGLPTLKDILSELEKPGRDPRKTIRIFEFSNDVYRIEDLRPGMILPGIVTNITNFGIFVDVGVKQDGLVHISQLADRYVSHPSEVVILHQHVTVKVLEVDPGRKRIQLSMKDTDARHQ